MKLINSISSARMMLVIMVVVMVLVCVIRYGGYVDDDADAYAAGCSYTG